MVYIAAPPHVATRALGDRSVRFIIAVVAAAKVGRSGDLDDAPAAIADIAECGGSSRAEADVQERNERDHGRSSYGGLWRIGVLVARHRFRGAEAAEGCGASARWWCSIVSDLS